MKKVSILFAAAACLGAGFLFFQHRQPITGAPQIVRAQSPTDPIVVNSNAEGDLIRFSARNQSNQPIRAFVLAVTYKDKTGKETAIASTNQVYGLDTTAAESALKPGSSTSSAKGFPIKKNNDGSVDSYEINVDYVLFEDNTTWGPDKTKQSLNIRGILQGWSTAHALLQRTLKQQGIGAVENILTKGVGHNHP